jgi:chemotaxis protein methyltransferase CheR
VGTTLSALRLSIERRFGLETASIPGFDDRVEAAIEQLLPTLSEVGSNLVRESPELLDLIMQRVRIGETRFFRDAEQLDALADEVLPDLAANGPLRALSAGCSTGEEAWTLAMLIERARGARGGLADRVLGIDLGHEAIEVARRARYPRDAIASLPKSLAAMWVSESDAVVPRPSLRSKVRFASGDLRSLPLSGPYEIITCRNVLIYLTPETARSILQRLAEALAPSGVLVVSRGEAPRAREIGLTPRTLADGAVTVFCRTEIAPASRGQRARLRVGPSSLPETIARDGAELLARRARELHVIRDGVLRADVEAELSRLRTAAEAMGMLVFDVGPKSGR